MKEITAEELKKKIDDGGHFTCLDVREPFEIYISSLPTETTVIPLDELASRFDELGKHDEIIVMCRSGNRSKTACELLIEHGFSNVSNMQGGMNSWAEKIDPSLPRY